MNQAQFPELSVLVGEDHEVIREFLSYIFDLLNVKRIDIVEDGAKAISLAKEHAYDLIFLDINMPLKNGFEVALEKKHFLGSPILVGLTANTDELVKLRCINSGMVEVLIKPVTIEDITELMLAHFKDKAVE